MSTESQNQQEGPHKSSSVPPGRSTLPNANSADQTNKNGSHQLPYILPNKNSLANQNASINENSSNLSSRRQVPKPSRLSYIDNNNINETKKYPLSAGLPKTTFFNSSECLTTSVNNYPCRNYDQEYTKSSSKSTIKPLGANIAAAVSSIASSTSSGFVSGSSSINSASSHEKNVAAHTKVNPNVVHSSMNNISRMSNTNSGRDISSVHMPPLQLPCGYLISERHGSTSASNNAINKVASEYSAVNPNSLSSVFTTPRNSTSKNENSTRKKTEEVNSKQSNNQVNKKICLKYSDI